MRLGLCLLIVTIFALVLGQQQEQEQEQGQVQEQERQEQQPTESQQVQPRPSENRETEEQQSDEQQNRDQQPNEQQGDGFKRCISTGSQPGPNAVVIAPGLSVEFDAESRDIRSLTFQAAPGWSPDSLSSCTVRAGRTLPTSGKKVCQGCSTRIKEYTDFLS